MEDAMAKADDDATTPRLKKGPEQVNPLDYEVWSQHKKKQEDAPLQPPPVGVALQKRNALLFDPLFGSSDGGSPPEGCLYPDAAVARIMQRLGVTERVASKRLLDALEAAEVWAWKRLGPSNRIKVAAADWIGGNIDLDFYRENGGGGVHLKDRRFIHQHRFLIPQDIFEHWLEQPKPLTQGRAAKPKHNGLNFAAADLPLVQEMRRLIKAGQARSPEDAARAVVSRAEGHGDPRSRVGRLAKRYRAHSW
jgi:hypothetical protein